MKIAKDPAETGSIVEFVPFFKALLQSRRGHRSSSSCSAANAASAR